MKYKIIALIVYIFLIINFIEWISGSKEKKDSTVKLSKIENSFDSTDNVSQNKELNIISSCTGKIKKINFKEGDYVSRGTILAELDDAHEKIVYENAKFNYAAFKESYDNYLNRIKDKKLSEEQIYNIKISLESYESELENAKKEWEGTKIKAPFDGLITSKNIELDSIIVIGTSIATIIYAE